MFLRKYISIASIQAKTEKTYLFNLFSKGAIIALRIWIIAQLYEASFSSGVVGQIEGITPAMIIWMVTLTQAFGIVTSPDVGTLISEDVRKGEIAYSLLRPISYPMQQFAGFWGRSAPSLILGTTLSVIVAFLLVGGFELHLKALFFGSILLILGLTLHFLISLSIGLLAFWTEDVSAFRWIYQKLYIMLGGMILPPAIFPERLQWIVERLPFAHLFYSASEVIVLFDYTRMMQHLCVQVGWVILLSIVSYFLYQKGVRRVAQNGG